MKKRKLLASILTLIIVSTSTTPIFADTSQKPIDRNPLAPSLSSFNLDNIKTAEELQQTNSEDSAEMVLLEFAEALSNKDFDTYRSITDESINAENIPGELQDSHEGMYNYKSIELIKYKEIEPTDTGGSVEISRYNNEYTDIHVYAAKYDCEVYEEDVFFFNGFNYVICVVGMDDDSYKLIDFKKPALAILGDNARFYEEDEAVQLFIEKQRTFGNIIGSDGELLYTNRVPAEEVAKAENKTLSEYYEENPVKYEMERYNGLDGQTVEEYISQNPIEATSFITARETPSYPSTIRVCLYKYGDGLNDIVTVSFEGDYVQRCTMCEWGTYADSNGNYHAMPDVALEAGAITCKNIGWYNILYDPGTRFDVYDNGTDPRYGGVQEYNPNQSVPQYVVDAVNAVKGVALYDGYYKIALPAYIAGAYSDKVPTNLEGVYCASQNGSAYLVNTGVYDDWFDLLGYYYNRRGACLANPISKYYY